MTYFFRRSVAATLLLSTTLPMSALAQTAPETYDDDDIIIVTASPLNKSVDESITGVSVLYGDELLDRISGTIGETLKSEPGVSSTFFGAGASRPIIRGQGGDRVRVLTNGVGSIDASSASPDHAVSVEPAQAERIEVVRGASLLRYGSSGSGGIVNVIDGRVPTEMPDGIDGAIRLGASSVDQGAEVAGSVDFGIGSNLVLHLDGTWRDGRDYRIPGEAESAIFHALEESEEEDHDDDDHDHEEEEETPDTGQLENSFANSQSLTGGLSWIGDSGSFIGVSLHSYESEYGIPGGHGHGHEDEHEGEDHDEEEEEEEEEEQVFINLEQIRMDMNGALMLDGAFEKIQFFGGYADYTHTEFEGPGEVGTVFKNEGYEGRAELIQAERDGWAAAYGLQFRERDFTAIGEEAFVPPTQTKQFALFTFQEKDFSDFHLEGAARLESTTVENLADNTDREFNLFSVSAGGDVHLVEKLRLGGTVFRTERAATAEELFANGPHLATNQFEIGDATLDKEVSTGIEAAVRFKSGQHFVTANVFYTDYSDYIYEVETGAEEDELPVYQYVAEDANFTGFELQGGAPIGTLGAFDINADGLVEYVRAKTESSNLPRIPPLSLLGGIEAESDRFVLRAELDYAAEQKKLGAEEIPTEDYTLVNLFTTWKSPAGAQNVRLKLSVLNLFDEEARQHTSFLKDQVPLPGRNVRFSISSRF